MPTYRYECPNGHTLEDFEPMSAPTERLCPELVDAGNPRILSEDDRAYVRCGATMKRVIGTGGGVIWKGGSPTRRFHK